MQNRTTVDCSVIIVSWNVRQHLGRCLQSLQKQEGVSFEIHVVDNGSSDGTPEYVHHEFPSVRLTVSKRNLGFARANNLAFKNAVGRHILFLNPDTELPETALAQTVRYLDSHGDVGVLGPKLLNPDASVQPSVRRFPTLLSQIFILLKLHVFFPWLPPLQRYFASDFSYDRETDVDQVMGAFFACPRAFLASVGNWDESFFLWFEEVDLCKRARTSGWKVRFVPAITCVHYGGSSFEQWLSVELQIVFVRSVTQYFLKYHGFLQTCIIALVGIVSIPLSLLEHFLKPILLRYVPKNA